MPVVARPRLVLVLVATAWALVFAIAGFRALELGSARESVVFSAWVWRCGGWTMLAAAQLVFSATVADRYFPHASPIITGAAELAAIGAFLVGVALLVTGAFT